jgi:catechol 2,3-dioxygenase-like lactoylglutathione lyase family enzyme
MDLGWYELSLDVQDIERSCDFYAKLGFQLIGRSSQARTATLQRGNSRIGLYNGRAPETVLVFWQGNVEAIVNDLHSKGLRFERGPSSDDNGVGALLKDPDGLAIYFVNINGKTRNGPADEGRS